MKPYYDDDDDDEESYEDSSGEEIGMLNPDKLEKNPVTYSK